MAKINENDDVQTKSKHCRVCLGSRGLIPIFGDEKHPDISIELMIFGRVEVHRDDDFPRLLCKQCSLLLDGAVSFRKTAIRSDAILKERKKVINRNNLFFLVKTDKDIYPPKNCEKPPHIFFEENFLKSNATDHQTAVKIEIENKDEINENESITVIAKKGRKECVKGNQDFHLTDDLSKHKQYDCHTIKKQECPICKKMFYPHYLNIHIQLHKPKRKIECTVCKKVFSEKYYKAHLKTHNGGKGDYICDVCGKDFIIHAVFMKHRTTHTNDLPFKCDYCPYRGRNKDLLRIHTRTHTGDYQYKCDQCNARYTTKSNLSKHMQRHRGAIDFHCDSCNRGFYTKLELERHISAIHLGIKNHLCNLCGAAFGYKNNLMNHMRRVHKKIAGKGGRMALYLKFQSENVK